MAKTLCTCLQYITGKECQQHYHLVLSRRQGFVCNFLFLLLFFNMIVKRTQISMLYKNSRKQIPVLEIKTYLQYPNSDYYA